MRSRIVLVLLFLCIAAVVFYSPLSSYVLNDFIISRIEKALDVNIVLGKTRFKFPMEVDIADINVIDGGGSAFVAEGADFKLCAVKVARANIVLDCNFKNVKLKSGYCGALNDILKPLGVPPQDAYAFDGLKGVLTVQKKLIAVDDLDAFGPDFKLAGRILRLNGKKVDYELKFDVNSRALAADAEKGDLFIDEDKDGWYSIELSMKGDPHKPTDLFFSTGGIKLQVKPDGK